MKSDSQDVTVVGVTSRAIPPIAAIEVLARAHFSRIKISDTGLRWSAEALEFQGLPDFRLEHYESLQRGAKVTHPDRFRQCLDSPQTVLSPELFRHFSV